MQNHDELIAVINEDFNYLAHYGVPGQEWYKNKAERYQNHAKYASGNPRYAVRGNKKSDKKKEDWNKPDPKYAIDRVFGVTSLPISAALAVSLPFAADPITLAVGATATAAMFGLGAVTAKMAANAYKKENENEQRMEKLLVDEKTGFHLKTQNFTQIEDLSKINPGFNNLRGDTKANCAFCTVAYDLRRRGYDVAANKSLIGHSTEDLKRWYPNAKKDGWITRYTIQDYNRKRARPTKTLESELQNKLSKQGDGARGELAVNFKFGWCGHSMAYEVINGTPYILDGQTNEVYRAGSNKYNRLLKSVHAVEIHRLDNIDFDPSTIKEAVH